MNTSTCVPEETQTNLSLFIKGALAISPLCIAILPWGILAGSMAIETNLTATEGIGLSVIVFAGATQLAAMGMIKAGAGLFTILLSSFFISSQHFLYGLALREHMSRLPFKWRLILGFLLTDELFAIVGNHSVERFNRWYAFGAGFFFYIVWIVCTILGVFAAKKIPNLGSYGLDFSIAATFIAIVIPVVKHNTPMLACMISAVFFSVVFHYFDIGGALIFSGLIAMFIGLLTSNYLEKERQS
ncbi:AzlC family ABC transporter permease [Neisseria sp. Ec49-e6-T10]|uniref:AzlC family ABC transporter permease n=1 Tax=Neisseria sp. Ec49-e6-T10 TaxID=3140744 RepID=UPI003EC0EB08